MIKKVRISDGLNKQKMKEQSRIINILEQRKGELYDSDFGDLMLVIDEYRQIEEADIFQLLRSISLAMKSINGGLQYIIGDSVVSLYLFDQPTGVEIDYSGEFIHIRPTRYSIV